MIRDAYDDQLINSERGMQVHFCVQLMKIFEDRKLPRRLFIEPTLTFDGKVLRSPDLLICDSGKVIGAIEFKYTPRQKSAFNKDLETLRLLSEVGGKTVTVANERYRGSGHAKQYSIAEDAVLSWAAIHVQDECPLPDENDLTTNARFLCLEARTRADASPELFANNEPIDSE